MTWYGIEMKTLFDKSTSKIAELLLQGTNMGIIEGRKLLNNNDTTEEIHSLVQEYVDMQEDAVEKLHAAKLEPKICTDSEIKTMYYYFYNPKGKRNRRISKRK